MLFIEKKNDVKWTEMTLVCIIGQLVYDGNVYSEYSETGIWCLTIEYYECVCVCVCSEKWSEG